MVVVYVPISAIPVQWNSPVYKPASCPESTQNRYQWKLPAIGDQAYLRVFNNEHNFRRFLSTGVSRWGQLSQIVSQKNDNMLEITALFLPVF